MAWSTQRDSDATDTTVELGHAALSEARRTHGIVVCRAVELCFWGRVATCPLYKLCALDMHTAERYVCSGMVATEAMVELLIEAISHIDSHG